MQGESRKLQEVGGGTFTVSVPKEWATEHSLSAGDPVTIYPEADGSLVVCSACDRGAPVTAAVDIERVGQGGLAETVRAAYAAGIDRLTLSAADEFDPEHRRAIDRAVRDLTSTRVVETADDRVTIRTAIDDGQVSMQRTVVQVQFVTLSLFRTAVGRALSEPPAGEGRIDDRRADVTRLVSLLTRQFTSSLSRPSTAATLDVDRPTAFDYYRTADALDRVARLSTDVAALADEPLPDDAVSPIRSATEAVRLYVEEATTRVVDHPAAAPVAELGDARTEVTAHLDEVAETLPDTGAGHGAHRLLAACAMAGDRIATVAHQAALRRGAGDQ